MVVSGDNPNPIRQELWEGPIRRSFDQPDGARRIDDLIGIMRPVHIDGAGRHMIYPSEDARILRVIRKIIRGLAHYHGLFPFLPDDRVWVDVQRYEIPQQFISEMTYYHREPDVADYWYGILDDAEVHSAWLLKFLEAPAFVGIVHADSGGEG